MEKILKKILLFLGWCPICRTKLFTWSYGKYKCLNCKETTNMVDKLLQEDLGNIQLEDGFNLLLNSVSSLGTGDFFLKEDGGIILQESGYGILLESSSGIVVTGPFSTHFNI